MRVMRVMRGKRVMLVITISYGNAPVSACSPRAPSSGKFPYGPLMDPLWIAPTYPRIPSLDDVRVCPSGLKVLITSSSRNILHSALLYTSGKNIFI